MAKTVSKIRWRIGLVILCIALSLLSVNFTGDATSEIVVPMDNSGAVATITTDMIQEMIEEAVGNLVPEVDEVEVSLDEMVEDVVVSSAINGATALVTEYAAQPEHLIGNGYTENTDQLRDWAKSNMHEIDVPIYATQMVIELAKPLETENQNIIIYIESGKWFCGGRIRKNSFEATYTHTFDSIDLIPVTCEKDMISKMNGQTINIGWYVSVYNGNQITNIRFE